MLPRLHRLPRSSSAVPKRSFASTVLLSRKWENETVVDLRKEAKARGLSTQGNKSTLVARIREHEENRLEAASQSNPPAHAPSAIRRTSTKIAPSTSSPNSQADSPGIPLPAKYSPSQANFWAVKLPDITKPAVAPRVQIPYLPDLWDSAKPKENRPAETEPELPKLHVVSGSATHYAGGPTHNLETPQESGVLPTPTTVQPAEAVPKNEGGIVADMWESLGLPRSFSALQALLDAGKQVEEAFKEKRDKVQVVSRPLTDGEKRGVYGLLGLIGGSWVVSAFVNELY